MSGPALQQQSAGCEIDMTKAVQANRGHTEIALWCSANAIQQAQLAHYSARLSEIDPARLKVYLNEMKYPAVSILSLIAMLPQATFFRSS